MDVLQGGTVRCTHGVTNPRILRFWDRTVAETVRTSFVANWRAVAFAAFWRSHQSRPQRLGTGHNS
jgi:hypothetical protein